MVITSYGLSEQVYLLSDSVVKLYVEGGLEASVHSLGTEVSLSLSLSVYLSTHPTDVLYVYNLSFIVYSIK